MKTLRAPLLTGLISFLILLRLHLMGQEKQVPFFPDQKIIKISRSYAEKMSFFQEYENFLEAQLYLKTDSTYALEIFYDKNGTVYKDRKLLSESEKDQYLQSLLNQYAEANKEVAIKDDSGKVIALNQNGRSALLVTSTLSGLGYYGWALPLTFNAEDEKFQVALYMIASSSSFYIPYKSTQFKNVSMAQASLSFYGQTRGIMYGMLLGDIMTKDIDYDNPNYTQLDNDRQKREQTLFGLGMLTSVTGGITGFRMAEKWGYEGGDVSIMQMWGDAGTIGGFLLSSALKFYDEPNENKVYATTLITSAIGLGVGKKFADTRNYTLGDAIVFRSTLALGCLIPVTIVNYGDRVEEETYSTAALIGGLGAGFIGSRLLRGKDFETSDGVYTALGEVAGALLGAGIGYLVAPENNDGKLILTTTTIGAAAGYRWMFKRYDKRSGTSRFDPTVDMNINPLALLMNKQSLQSDILIPTSYLANMKIRF